MNQVIASWSGGKDSCLAYCLAEKMGLQVRTLVNIITEDRLHSCTHGLPAELLRLQSEAIGVPLYQLPTSGARYETDFRNMLSSFKKQGMDGAVFGNGDVERQWIDSVCRSVGIKPYLPLEELPKDQILIDFTGLGFEAIVVTVNAAVLGKEWLGRKLDADFIKDIAELRQRGVLNTENQVGLYHSMTVDGPIFKKRLEVVQSNRVLRDGYWFLDVTKMQAVPALR